MLPFPLRIPPLFCRCHEALLPDTYPEPERPPYDYCLPYEPAPQLKVNPVCCFQLFLHQHHPLCSATPRRSAHLVSRVKVSPTLQASPQPLSTELSEACRPSAPRFVPQREHAYSAARFSKPYRPGFDCPAEWSSQLHLHDHLVR